nr:MAG TPA: protein of unknown function (DUF5370) [Caudoviricetes sp.]
MNQNRKKANRTITGQFPDTYRIETMVNCYCRKNKKFRQRHPFKQGRS